jgi:hypothetical protein
MSYTVTISRIERQGGGCRPPMAPTPHTACNRPSFYWVVTAGDNGNQGGAEVCAKHLFSTMGYFLGLPEHDG